MQLKVLCSFGLLSLLGSAAMATPIYIDASGREWLDANDTRYRSWNDTAAVCSAGTGDCSGILAATGVSTNDVDVTGYRWATRDEVRELFYEVAGLPSGALDSYSATFPIGTGFGTNAFGIFEPTIQLPFGPGLVNIYNGLTREVYLGSDLLMHGYSGVIQNPPFGSDSFTITGGLATDIREISMGVYLYKAVPEPGTLSLFALGIAVVCFGATRRRRIA